MRRLAMLILMVVVLAPRASAETVETVRVIDSQGLAVADFGGSPVAIGEALFNVPRRDVHVILGTDAVPGAAYRVEDRDGAVLAEGHFDGSTELDVVGCPPLPPQPEPGCAFSISVLPDSQTTVLVNTVTATKN